MDNKRYWLWLALLGAVLIAVFMVTAREGRRLLVTTVQAGGRPEKGSGTFSGRPGNGAHMEKAGPEKAPDLFSGPGLVDSRPVTELREKAPEFRNVAEGVNTKPLQMNELRGKVVAVNFWAFGLID